MCAFRGARRRASRAGGRIALAMAAIGSTLPPALGQDPAAVTSSGLGTSVTASPVDGGTKYSIRGGTASGSNLFHSLGLFNLPNVADIADFENDGARPTTDIVARVTGAQPSSIFGTIRTSGFGSANLFLINPSGWIFGPTASLEVRGSFHASTAQQVRLGDGVFDASTVEAQAVLMSAPPSAFGFLGPTGSISVQQSFLGVDRGKTMSFVGGDVTIQAALLAAPGGRIQIGSFAAEGQATVDGLQGAFAALGRVEISGGASISAAGNVQVDALGIPSAVNGGTALIRGGEINIAEASVDVSGVQDIDIDGNPLLSAGGTVVIRGGRLFIDASAVTAQTHGAIPGGQAAIDVAMEESINVKNGALLMSANSGPARGGAIHLRAGGAAGTIAFESASAAFTQTSGTGRGGDLRLEGGSVSVDDAQLATLSLFGEGIGGDVALAADTVALTGGASIQSINQNATRDGRGGGILVRARDSVMILGQSAFGGSSGLLSSTVTAGDGGRILVEAPSLTMQSATTITSSASFEEPGGAGGDIVLDVGRLRLTGGATINTNVSAPAPSASFAGGNVLVQTAGEAEISGANAGIFSIAFGAPPGGIALRVGSLRLVDGALIQGGSFAGDSEGAKVTVEAEDSILIAERAGLSSQALNLDVDRVEVSARSLTIDRGFINTGTLGAGRAGNVSIDVGTLVLTRGGQIASSSVAAASGGGGAVAVTAGASVAISGSAPGGEPVLPEPFRGFIDDTASGIFSTASGLDPQAGAAGSISVTTPALDVNDRGKISASSTGSANARAGDVNVTFGDTLLLRGGSITTQSLRADGGNIAIASTGSLLHLSGGQITTSVQSGVGAGGNITLGTHAHPLALAVLFNSAVQANAFGGPGGNIGIFADVYLTSGSVVSASSALSTPGTIGVEARVTDLSGSLAQLPADVLQAAALLRASCAARLSEGQASSLVVAGREGVPPAPEGLLWSPLAAAPAEPDLARVGQRDSEPFPRFTPIWLSFNCAR